MKKLFTMILGVLFIIPITVKADMGAPSIKEVKVTPISKDGATIYNLDFKKTGTLKSGDTFTVTFEETNKGEKYGCTYTDDTCVKMSEVTALSKAKKGENDVAKYAGRVFAKSGVEVYEGPSYAYKKTSTTIPYNADIKVSDLSLGEGTWAYVEYNDVTGYVDTADSAVVQLYNAKIKVITNNKEYKEFFRTNMWDGLIYVLEDGKYVSHHRTDIAYEFEYESNIALKQDCKLHKYADTDDQEKDVIGSIKKGEKPEILYSYGDYGYSAYYVKNGEDKGWLVSTVTRDDTDSVTDMTFDCFDIDYDKLIQKNNVKDEGKVLAKDYKETKNNAKQDIVIPENNGEDDPQPTGDVITPGEDDKKDEEKDLIFGNWTKDQIILASCIGGTAIVITAVVTIILVNKKGKKNKVVEDKKEEKDESVQE